MGARSKDGPVGNYHSRTYRAEGGNLSRGLGVMQGTADDQAKAPTGAAVRVLGVVAEDGAVGKATSIVTHGETIGIAGAAIAANDCVKVMASGKWEPGNAADVEIGGRAVTSADADTDEFVIFVNPIQKRS